MALVPTYREVVEYQNTQQEFLGLYAMRNGRTYVYGVCVVLDNSGYFVGNFVFTFTLRVLTGPLGKDVGGDSVTL